MSSITRPLLLLLLFPFFAGCSLSQPDPRGSSESQARSSAAPADDVQRIIFDTDVGGDVDDAGPLAVLHALADRGEIELLAMGVVIGHDAGVPFVHAVNTWYGRPDLPIGTIKQDAPYARDEYMEEVIQDFPYTLTQDAAPDVVDLYRKVLAAQPDKSVTLITVGPATNIRNLLQSQPDEHSPLDGVELVRRKVKLYAAGGNGDAGLPDGRCGFNYRTDLKAAQGELELLPGDLPTVFAGGSGVHLSIGAALRDRRPDHIIRRSYEAYFDGVAKDRQTWDQLRVIYASRPSIRSLFDLSAAGQIQVDDDQNITHTPSAGHNHAYAYLNDVEAMRAVLTELMLHEPQN